MIRVGLTGGIGSGKSYIASIFSHLGVPIFNADDYGKLALKDAVIQESLLKFFNNEIVEQIKQGNLTPLSELVFSDSQKLKTLMQLTHPYIISSFKNWCSKQQAHYVIIEAAVLLESDIKKEVDKIIVVSATEQTRFHRVLVRGGLSADDIRKRMSMQINDVERLEKADFIINNELADLLLPQLLKINQSLLRLK